MKEKSWKELKKELLNIRNTNSKQDPFFRMYHRDRYARDRVMKSARMLLPYLKKGETVADIGCYTQEVRKYLPQGIAYVGVDEKAWVGETQILDLNHPPFSNLPKADHYICLETLEHLIQPGKLLESLSTNGYIVVSLPNESTLFHRLRGLLGVMDAECFSGEGKHLHLPSLGQARRFLESTFDIVHTKYYISPSGCGSRQAWIGRILSTIPDCIHQWLADKFPSLFARGFIFLCKKKESEETQDPGEGPIESTGNLQHQTDHVTPPNTVAPGVLNPPSV